MNEKPFNKNRPHVCDTELGKVSSIVRCQRTIEPFDRDCLRNTTTRVKEW
ncbi:hypothetical protein M6B38_290155 [Iris pallida]|uniref:Uncharacterized protein n=1 Tax=Iris pallida TaxID=29817 RepID=A0AAX6HWY1_IRIPA|nr:hypothetical protein M6B38_290155 [Iris pallida]